MLGARLAPTTNDAPRERFKFRLGLAVAVAFLSLVVGSVVVRRDTLRQETRRFTQAIDARFAALCCDPAHGEFRVDSDPGFGEDTYRRYCAWGRFCEPTCRPGARCPGGALAMLAALDRDGWVVTSQWAGRYELHHLRRPRQSLAVTARRPGCGYEITQLDGDGVRSP